eukprot:TRINITY_DN2722_c0_g1_i1.p1 TRINITY_DN2722_c0_g1~~TRINITY_DN2722_c0_g1_i1.p1  ORF type:complete len:450 (-),score=92.78 TRINITY_DN2722_c0_g1_i1:29-1378(-)
MPTTGLLQQFVVSCTVVCCCLLLLVVTTCSSSIVTINGRRIQVDGKDFFVKGVNYAPVPVGQWPGQTDVFNNTAIIDRDMALLSKLGVNTIRIYGVGNPTLYSNYVYFLDKAYSNGIYVIFSFWFPTINFSNATQCTQTVSDFQRTVNAFKTHPAILMWMFGNELNFVGGVVLADLFSCINHARNAAHLAEGNTNWHPVTSSMADGSLSTVIPAYDSAVDVWSLQIYRGSSFFNLFSSYANSSSKPMVITEFGIDAYDSRVNAVNESMQAEVDMMLFSEILKNNQTCSGGLIFEFMDEWWKAGNPSTHVVDKNACNAPDGFCSSAFYGMCAVSSGGAADVVTPRQVYTSYQALLASTGDVYGSSSSSSGAGSNSGSGGGAAAGGGQSLATVSGIGAGGTAGVVVGSVVLVGAAAVFFVASRKAKKYGITTAETLKSWTSLQKHHAATSV